MACIDSSTFKILQYFGEKEHTSVIDAAAVCGGVQLQYECRYSVRTGRSALYVRFVRSYGNLWRTLCFVEGPLQQVAGV